MKFFLSSLAATVLVGIWMVVVASSQLAALDQLSKMETVSGAYSNPVNRSLKQDRLSSGKVSQVQTKVLRTGNLCSVGGFDRACKFQIAGLKISPPLVLTN